MIIIKGEVIHGAQLGRKMGFPTANLPVGAELTAALEAVLA